MEFTTNNIQKLNTLWNMMIKILNFLDFRVKNDQTGKYEFGVHRKDAITNVQVKKHSSHNPNIQTAIIKGFVNIPSTICSEKHIEEPQLLIDVCGEWLCNVRSKTCNSTSERKTNTKTRTTGESETSSETKGKKAG